MKSESQITVGVENEPNKTVPGNIEPGNLKTG